MKTIPNKPFAIVFASKQACLFVCVWGGGE